MMRQQQQQVQGPGKEDLSVANTGGSGGAHASRRQRSVSPGNIESGPSSPRQQRKPKRKGGLASSSKKVCVCG